MAEGVGMLPSVFAVLLATAIVVGVTVAALGPRRWDEARRGWRALAPRTPAEAAAEIARIEAMRRDPETANMYFLSRFIVMVVQEAVGQMLAGILAALPVTEDVSDKIVEAPFAIGSLWLALVCLIVYRRIDRFETWRAGLIARITTSPESDRGARDEPAR